MTSSSYRFRASTCTPKVTGFLLKAASIVLLLTLSSAAQGGVIFDQTQTGADLLGNASVSFPNGPPTTSGTSIDFVSTSNGIMLKWDLLAAAPRAALFVEFVLSFTPLSTDNDPSWGLSDGLNAQALMTSDNGGGDVRARRGTHNATSFTQVDLTTWCGPPGANVDPATWKMDLSPGSAGPASISNYQAGTYSCVGPFALSGNHLDIDQALSFMLIGHTPAGERYRVNSVSIKITEEDPIPVNPTAWGLIKALYR